MFHLFLSDYSKQDSATTSAHSKHMLQLLQHRNILRITRRNKWENIYLFAYQSRCAIAFYLLSMLSHAHDIIIDLGVGSPVYGKYFVGGLNVNEKRYLSMLMKTLFINVNYNFITS